MRGSIKNLLTIQGRQMSTVLKRNQTCGILGGLGPEATIQFLQCIINKTSTMYGAVEDQNHVHTVIELNPQVPNRNHAINGTGEDCGPVLSKMSRNLVKAEVDFVVCACNTAHAFQKEIEQGCGDVPFLSMIEVTSNKVQEKIEQNQGPRKCGILAGGGCIQAGLYQKSLSARNIEAYVPTSESQELMQDIIYRIKAGDKSSQVLEDFITVLKECKEENGCNQIILGCTELPLIFNQCMEIYDKITLDDIVDSSEALVETIVIIAKGDQDINEILKNKRDYVEQQVQYSKIENQL